MTWYWVYQKTEDKKGELDDLWILEAIFRSEEEAKKYKKEKDKRIKQIKSDFEIKYFIEQKDNF